jgi:hypothetical protein
VHESLSQAGGQGVPRKRASARSRPQRTPSRTKLTPEFWSHFVEQFWGQRPLLIKQPFASPLTTSGEIFSAIKNASQQFRVGGADCFFRFYTEEGFLLTGPKLRHYIPETSDLSAADYGNRMTRKLHGQRFGLVISQFQAHEARLWLRVRKFLSQLSAELPAQPWVEIVSFVGNYDKSPFGIHQDDVSVFHFVVEGRKRMYLWPRDYFSSSDDVRVESDFATLRRDAVMLEAKAGDIIFWPANFWHVGESVGGLSSSISIALGPLRPAENTWELLLAKIRERLEPSFTESNFPTTLAEAQRSIKLIPKMSRLAVAALRKASHDPTLAQSLRTLWLNLMTGAGSDYVPPPLPWRILSDDLVIKGYPKCPILWTPNTDDDMICSTQGHSFTIPADPSIIRMFKRLNGGETARVGDLIAEHAGKTVRDGVAFNASPEGVRAVLSRLYSLRAITEKEMMDDE